MKIYITKGTARLIYKLLGIIFFIILLLVYINYTRNIFTTVFNSNEEVALAIEQMFQSRNKALVNEDLELIKPLYDISTKYGRWTFEYEQRKIKYIHNWELKQGISFIEINPKLKFNKIRKYSNKYSVNLHCVTEYKYIYQDKPEEVNISRIGTYHNLELINKEQKWIISKEWYKDPFGDTLNLNNINEDSIKDFILSQSSKTSADVNDRRLKAVEYAEKYNGASIDEQYTYKYNKKYKNYNSLGGDCANFASQVLYEGGKFRKNLSWNYDGRGATRSWVNAGGFTKYMLNSKRASLLGYGSYEKIYKTSYKLLPGDFIAYEDKGDITHVSVVTGYDSRGYAMVSCHNTDRNMVPWDLGWSSKSIKFWLVRVHY